MEAKLNEPSNNKGNEWNYAGPDPSEVYTLAKLIGEGDSRESRNLANRTAATRLLNIHLRKYMELVRKPEFLEITESLPERTEGNIEDYLNRLTPAQQEVYLFEFSIKGEMEILKIHLD